MSSQYKMRLNKLISP